MFNKYDVVIRKEKRATPITFLILEQTNIKDIYVTLIIDFYDKTKLTKLMTVGKSFLPESIYKRVNDV